MEVMMPFGTKTSTSGFSLLQVLVATVFTGALAVTVVRLVNMSLVAQKNTQNSVDFDLVKSSLNLVFNSKTCRDSLFSSPGQKLRFTFPGSLAERDDLFPGPAKADLYEIQLAGQKIVRVNESINGLSIQKLMLSSAVFEGDDGTYKNFSAMLEIEGKKHDGSLGKQILSAQLGVFLQVQRAGIGVGLVEKCLNASNLPTAPPAPAPPPAGMGDVGAFYMDTAFATLPGASSQGDATQAINACNNREAQLCDVMELVAACSRGFITLAQIPSSKNVCAYGGGGAPASYNRSNCKSGNNALQGWIPGGCQGDVYRCCKKK